MTRIGPSSKAIAGSAGRSDSKPCRPIETIEIVKGLLERAQRLREEEQRPRSKRRSGLVDKRHDAAPRASPSSPRGFFAGCAPSSGHRYTTSVGRSSRR